jgi:Rrf2 family iron-sulfur cluster assembly transcriptional regulator
LIRYGKTTQNAIAAMSRLAEVYEQATYLSSSDIAKSRQLSQTLVAKLLTTLSRAGLVSGAPGPGGGYALAKLPAEITLYDITTVFERTDDRLTCPFGPNWCGNNDPCPLHDQLGEIDARIETFLKSTTLEQFKPNSKRGARKVKGR